MVCNGEKTNAVTHKTTGNIFSDLGFSGEESENLKVRAQLMQELTHIIKETGDTQTEEAEILAQDEAQLRVEPFFRKFLETGILDPETGSQNALAHRAHILSYDIPSLSFAAGGTKIKKKSVLDDANKVDMNSDFKRDGWPIAHVDREDRPA